MDKRHRLHLVVRGAIDDWNNRKEMLHMGHKIDLAAEITEALMAAGDGERPQEKKS